MNGSELFENPDADGYDVTKDGVLTQNEMFVNYLEYHIRSGLFLDNQTLDGMELPNGFTTDLFDNISDFGLPEADFATRASGAILAGQISIEKGSTDPFSADSDDDGMPDGWEIWFARWNVIDDEWTLNPLQPSDRWLDADDDGMTNWEEYNLIDSVYRKRTPIVPHLNGLSPHLVRPMRSNNGLQRHNLFLWHLHDLGSVQPHGSNG